jgi:hypothetical protein
MWPRGSHFPFPSFLYLSFFACFPRRKGKAVKRLIASSRYRAPREARRHGAGLRYRPTSPAAEPDSSPVEMKEKRAGPKHLFSSSLRSSVLFVRTLSQKPMFPVTYSINSGVVCM